MFDDLFPLPFFFKKENTNACMFIGYAYSIKDTRRLDIVNDYKENNNTVHRTGHLHDGFRLSLAFV